MINVKVRVPRAADLPLRTRDIQSQAKNSRGAIYSTYPRKKGDRDLLFLKLDSRDLKRSKKDRRLEKIAAKRSNLALLALQT